MPTRAVVLVVGCGLFATAGCHLLLSSSPSELPADAAADIAILPDVALPDTPATPDLAPPDLPQLDIPPCSDAAGLIQSTDIGGSIPDGAASDSPFSLIDASPDTQSADARLFPTDPRVAQCARVLNISQCAAETLCNGPGWRLCSARQFLAAGGEKAYVGPEAWLASCVGDVATPVYPAPTNAICSSDCSGPKIEVNPLKIIGEQCDGTGVLSQTSFARVGVAAIAAGCQELGVNRVRGYWSGASVNNFDSGQNISAALCCRVDYQP